MAALETLSQHGAFGGVQGFYRHASAEIGLPMKFGVYRPPQALAGARVPALRRGDMYQSSDDDSTESEYGHGRSWQDAPTFDSRT